jgi:hypothetical protein
MTREKFNRLINKVFDAQKSIESQFVIQYQKGLITGTEMAQRILKINDKAIKIVKMASKKVSPKSL